MADDRRSLTGALRDLLRGSAPPPFERGRFAEDLEVALSDQPDLGGEGTILEAGAGSGEATMVLAARVEPPWTVMAFEPDPEAAEALRKEVSARGLTGRVQVFASAVGEKETTTTLALDLRQGRRHHRVVPKPPPEGPSRSTVSVRWDAHLGRSGLTRVGLVVVDVAGDEPVVLDSLRDYPLPVPVFAAYRPDALRRSGHEPPAFLERLRSRGELFWVDDGRLGRPSEADLEARVEADGGAAILCRPRAMGEGRISPDGAFSGR